MLGTEIGFAELLRRNNIKFPVIHWKTRDPLWKVFTLNECHVIVKVVVQMTNISRGGNGALTHRKFSYFLADAGT